MLKNRSAGEQIQGGDESKPRKKLSFRDPEVMSPPKTPPHSAPAKSCSPPQFTRPHSVAGVMGLGGFSALGGVPGLSNTSSPPSHGPNPKGVTASPGISSTLPPRILQQHHKAGNHSPTRASPPSHSRHSSFEGMQIIQEQENFLQQKQMQQQRLHQKQIQQQHPLSQSYPQNSQSHHRQQERNKQTSQNQFQQNISENYNQDNQSSYFDDEVQKNQYYDQSPQLNQKKQQDKLQQPHQPTFQQPHCRKDDKKIQEQNSQAKSPSSSSSQITQKLEKPTDSLQSQKASSKVQRHHSLSPTRRTNRERFLSSGRNSDQALFTHSENYDSENQAMKVVRTVGQAFEVVHKLALKDKSPSPEPLNDDDISREGSEDSSDKPKKDGLDSESGQEDLMTLTSDTFNEDSQQENLPNRPSKLEPLAPPIGSDILSRNVGETFMSPLSDPLSQGDFLPQAGTPLSVHHELQLLREQLEQQQQQTQAAVAQVHLLRDQLAAETAARLEAQARTHQLLVHNKELLEHIQQLVLQVRELEVKFPGAPAGGNGLSTTISMLPNPPELKSEHQDPQIAHMIQQQQRSHLQQTQQQQHAHQYLTQQQQHQHQQAMRQRQYHISHETSVVDQDLKRDSIDSGRRLPQVPEDSISTLPLATPLGAQRGPANGPITRAASERYSRQETLAQLQRMAWARHTTK